MNKRQFKKTFKKEKLIFQNLFVWVKPKRRKWFIKRWKNHTNEVMEDLWKSLENALIYWDFTGKIDTTIKANFRFWSINREIKSITWIMSV